MCNSVCIIWDSRLLAVHAILFRYGWLCEHMRPNKSLGYALGQILKSTQGRAEQLPRTFPMCTNMEPLFPGPLHRQGGTAASCREGAVRMKTRISAVDCHDLSCTVSIGARTGAAASSPTFVLTLLHIYKRIS